MEDRIIENTASYTYVLTLGNSITNMSEALPQLRFVQGVGLSFTENNKKFSAILLGIKMNRKIYQPGEIEAELTFMQEVPDANGTVTLETPSMKGVSALLLQREVTLTVRRESPQALKSEDKFQEFTIAQHYFIHEVKPQLRRDTDGVLMYVKLNIFSMDKLMTLNKYSKAYVASKLGSGILMPECRNFNYQEDSKTSLIEASVTDMRFLKYESQLTFKDPKTNQTMVATIPSEFIHPYLVQYNESFYDFMVRTSNRCGEFFFFEDGKLTLGLPDSGEPIVIDEFESVTTQDVGEAPLSIKLYARDSVKEGTGAPKHFNFTPIKKEGSYPDGVFTDTVSYNSEYANDEYIFPLYKDKASDLAHEMMYGDGDQSAIHKIMLYMKKVAANRKGGPVNLAISAAQYGFPEAVQAAFTSRIAANNLNKKLRNNFFKPLKGKSEQYSDDCIVQFGTLSPKGWTTIDYFNDIRTHEERQQQQIICVNLGTMVRPLKLGQKIKIAGSSECYVIIHIVQNSEEAWKQNYDTYGKKADEKSDNIRSMMFYAIPSYDDNEGRQCFIPPVQPVSIIRKSGPQTAFIVASDDPKYQGRVRISFPWQATGDAEKNRLEKAASTLQQATEQRQRSKDELAQLEEEYLLLLKEQELMEEWKKLSPEEREKRAKALWDEDGDIWLLETENEKYEKAINDALQAIDKAENEVEKEALVFNYSPEIEENKKKIAANKKKIERIVALLNMMEASTNQSAGRDLLAEKKAEVKKTAGAIGAKQTAVQAAEQDVKEKEASFEKAKGKFDDKVKAMASPWIRVATPIATEGGGFYYEPRVGDEVLVNFDNDNVERPYVVGQLYSKNTNDPRERMNRKMSLRGLGSMALVSPNGHHIAFQDPDDSKKFIGDLLGPAKSINFISSLGAPSLPFLMPKQAKDLAGGIHIGDRFGLYEISMSSNGRSISINSPLGKVNLNAFTGISIVAPNGDIKIDGKNVEIKASNKLTIESGTNIGLGTGIGKPQYEWVKGKNFLSRFGHFIGESFHAFGHEVLLEAAPELGKEGFKQLPVTDITFFRYLMQTFLKPVDGTLCIKSHKYMLLEAGKGKAMIKNDRYRKAKPDDYCLVYENMIKYVNCINAGFDSFAETYKQLWQQARDAYMKYHEKAMRRLKIIDLPSVINLTFGPDPNEEWDVNKIVKAFDDRFKPNIKEKNKNELIELAKVYASVLYVLRRHMMKIESLDNFLEHAGQNGAEPLPEDHQVAWVKDAFAHVFADMEFKRKWLDCYKDINGLPEENFLTVVSPKDIFFNNLKETKRELAALFILQVDNSEQNKNDKYIYVGYGKEHITKERLTKDYYWNRFMQNMNRYFQNNFNRKLLMSFADKYWNDHFRNERWWEKSKPWNSEGGQILFSDNPNYTLNMVKDGLQSEEANNQNNINRLIEVLYTIK